jgi:hypothetical protein
MMMWVREEMQEGRKSTWLLSLPTIQVSVNSMKVFSLRPKSIINFGISLKVTVLTWVS